MDKGVIPPVELYDKVANAYDSLYTNTLSKAEDDCVKRLLLRHIPRYKTLRIVDLGCGTGLFMDLFPDARNVIGLDISPEMIKQARVKHPGTPWIVKDMRNTGLRTGDMDVVVSLYSSVSSVMVPEMAWIEIARVLRPGGRFFVMVFNRYSLRNMRHGFPRQLNYRLRYSNGYTEKSPVTTFSKGDIYQLTKKNFEDVEIRGLYAGRKLFKCAFPHTWIITGRRKNA